MVVCVCVLERTFIRGVCNSMKIGWAGCLNYCRSRHRSLSSASLSISLSCNRNLSMCVYLSGAAAIAVNDLQHVDICLACSTSNSNSSSSQSVSQPAIYLKINIEIETIANCVYVRCTHSQAEAENGWMDWWMVDCCQLEYCRIWKWIKIAYDEPQRSHISLLCSHSYFPRQQPLRAFFSLLHSFFAALPLNSKHYHWNVALVSNA